MFNIEQRRGTDKSLLLSFYVRPRYDSMDEERYHKRLQDCADAAWNWRPAAITVLLGASHLRTGKNSSLNMLPVFLLQDLAKLLQVP